MASSRQTADESLQLVCYSMLSEMHAAGLGQVISLVILLVMFALEGPKPGTFAQQSSYVTQSTSRLPQPAADPGKHAVS